MVRVASFQPSSGRIEEGSLDLRLVIARLEISAVDIGLLDKEVACILRMREGGWPMPVPEQWSALPAGRERRLRDLGEFCRLLTAVKGADAPMWLRRENVGVQMTPLDFLMEEPGGLAALCRALRHGVHVNGEGFPPGEPARMRRDVGE